MDLFSSDSPSNTEKDDLTLLNDVGAKRSDSLAEEGYDSYKSLAEASPDELISIESMSEERAKHNIHQARLLEGEERYTPHDSVDGSSLLEVRSRFKSQEKPLISRLKQEEKPLFIFYTRSKSPDIEGDEFDKIRNRNGITHLITNQRWLSIAGQKDGEETLEIPLEEIDSVSYKTGIRKHKVVFGVSDSKVTLPLGNLQTGEDVEQFLMYLTSAFDIEDEPEIPEDTTKTITLDSTEDDSFETNLEEGSRINIITEDNGRYARLIVPTQKSGATFSSGGWNFGTENIKKTTSKGKIVENHLEDFATRFVVKEDQIELGVMLVEETRGWGGVTTGQKYKGKSPEQTLRINTSDITDVRQETIEGLPGITFETQEDVYKLKIQHSGYEDTQPFEEDIRKATELIDENKSDNGSEPESQSSAPEDNITKLERLADLNEQGILSDDEFEEKKSELLDDI